MQLFFICFCLLFGCSDPKNEKNADPWQVIFARGEESIGRYPLYRVRVPPQWRRIDASPEDFLQDTTKEICQFVIEEGAEAIRIMVHNFPSHHIEDRIPPIAQVIRWKRQFDPIDPASQLTIPQSFSGYMGLLYEGKGYIEKKEKSVMGWVLQLGPEQYRQLSRGQPLQMRADVTIKASGTSALISKYRQAILSFARSFELIEEIPAG